MNVSAARLELMKGDPKGHSGETTLVYTKTLPDAGLFFTRPNQSRLIPKSDPFNYLLLLLFFFSLLLLFAGRKN